MTPHSTNEGKVGESIMKKKKIWPRVLIVVAVLACAVLVISNMLGEKSSNLNQVTARTGDLSTYYSFTGALSASRVQTVVAPQGAKVQDIYVAAGDSVKSGDRLARLSTGDLLKSDIQGEVTSVAAKEDDTLQAGATILTIADLDNLEVDIKVDEYDIPAIHMGQEVEMTVSALDETIKGTITAIDKLATQTQSATYYNVTVSIEADARMLPGMEVGMKVLKDEAKNAVLLHMDALMFDDNNSPYVLTMDKNGRTQMTPVTVGISDGSNVEIKSGMSAGDTAYYSHTITLADMRNMMMGGR